MKVTVRIVLEQAGTGCRPDFGVLVPSPTTVAAFDAAQRGEVVDPGTPAEAITELDRDD